MLADRLIPTQIESIDAVKLLTRIESKTHAVIYCDPPYAEANTSPYGNYVVDKDLLKQTLLKQCGRVAISGYKQEWDSLGWQRHALKTQTAGRRWNPRTEVLWTNYDANKL